MSRLDVTGRADAGAESGRGLTAAERQEFWINTCQEVMHMQICSQQVLDFYQKHGCRFAVPSRQQVQDVLDALDAALPHWEKEHPELFYQTLELNFPELLRRS